MHSTAFMTRRVSRLGSSAALVVAVAATALALLGGCTEDVGTSVRISLVYNDGWNIGSADVVTAKTEKRTQIAHEMLVLIPDANAGDVMSLEVWGVRDGTRIAHGSAVALPRKGETVGATIVLERLPCGVFCTEGDVRCEVNGYSTCGPDGDGCLQWGEAQSCPTETPFCSVGVCRQDCVDECTGGQGKCVDDKTEVRCGQFDSDTCLDFSGSITCTGTQVCYAGRCAVPCVFGTALTNTLLADSVLPFHPSLAIDSAGNEYAVYSVKDVRTLRYAKRPKGGSWSAWSDVGAIGIDPSLAVDAQGRLHLIFYDGTSATPGFKYATRGPVDVSWSTEIVKADAGVVISSALTTDAAGGVHIVYFAGTALKYSRKSGATWLHEAVTEGAANAAGGDRCDIALVGNVPHLSYYSDLNNIGHAVRTGENAWTREVAARPADVTIPADAATSIAVDRSGVVYIAYMERNIDILGTYYTLSVASNIGGWTHTIVDDISAVSTGAGATMAIDPFDGIHVAYRNTATPRLLYAYLPPKSSIWNLDLLPPSTPGLEASLAIEPTGAVHILSADRGAARGVVETTRTCPVP
jgi:hypothetical protein